MFRTFTGIILSIYYSCFSNYIYFTIENLSYDPVPNLYYILQHLKQVHIRVP